MTLWIKRDDGVNVPLPDPPATGSGDRAWMQDGRCAEVDPELWFPEKGGSARPAKNICAGCEVATLCLQYALDNRERHGIWGGKTERERALMLRRRTRQTHDTEEKEAA